MGSLPAYTPYYPSFVTLGQQQPAQQLAYGGQSVPYVVYGGAGAVQQQQGALSMASLQAGLDGLSLVDSMGSLGLGGGGLMQQQQQQRHPQAQLVGGGAAGGMVYDPYGAGGSWVSTLPPAVGVVRFRLGGCACVWHVCLLCSVGVRARTYSATSASACRLST